MKQWREIATKLTLLSQLGLSFIMPLLMCIGICWLLCDKLGVGLWVYIIGFPFGLASSFLTAYKFYVLVRNKEKKNQKKKVSFNNH